MKNSNNLIPAVVYENADLQKDQIFEENNKKSGIYRWINKINGKTYIGSAINIPKRLYQYYSKKNMETYLKKRKSAIYSAILKHGISNFKLEILKYCSRAQCIKGEQYYIDLLKPEYNILKIAGSLLGFKHSDESRAKMSAPKSEEHKANISASKMGNSYGKNQPNALKIQVTDLELNTKTTYNSTHEAARALNIPQSSISCNLKSKKQKPYKGRYVFTKI